MKAICIDSSNKPENISEYEWIEEGSGIYYYKK